MEYIFEKNRNFEDYSGGRVLYNRPGTTSFPARLGSEIFLRCKNHLEQKGKPGPYTLFDPCCGGGYLAAILGFLHGKNLKEILASDVEEPALELAERNLGLLASPGLRSRIEQLRGTLRFVS